IVSATVGAKLFQRLGFHNCDLQNVTGRGSSLVGFFGNTVKRQGCKSLVADEIYIRESILNPSAKVVAGYQPIMPTFKGLISEDGIFQIIAYLKSLNRQEGAQAQK